MKGIISAACLALAVAACSNENAPQTEDPAPAAQEPNDTAALKQSSEALLAGEVMAVAYSGFREGQHPDRGDGAVNPSAEEIREDLEILVAHGFQLIRMYDSGDRTPKQVMRSSESEAS